MTCKCVLGNSFRKIRLAIEHQDHLDRQNICVDKIFNKGLEQSFIIKALKLSLMEYRDSKVLFQGKLWEREELVELRKNELDQLGVEYNNHFDIPYKYEKIKCKIY